MTNFRWTSGVSGNWATAGDWTPTGGPPDASGDSALINAAGAYTVSVGSNITANQVTLDDAGAALKITHGATLNLTGTSQTLAVRAGTLDVSGTLIDNGSVGIVLVQGTVNNSGLISGIGIGILVDASAGIVNNSGTLVSTGSDGIFAQGSETISNLGTIHGHVYGLQLAGGSTVTNGASNDPQAMITSDSESVFFGGSGALTNFGTITGRTAVSLARGTITNFDLISSTGIDIIVGSGGGALTNSGVITSTGSDGIFAQGSETISNLGTIHGHVYGLQLAGGSTVTNGASNEPQAMITSDSESVFFGGSGALTNFGTITGRTAVSLARGTITNFDLISSTGIDIIVGSGGGALTNSGVITSTGSDGIFARGSETISNLGTIAALASIGNGVQLVNGTLTNGSASDTTATIVAGQYGVFSSGSITVDNYGTILGDPGNITTSGAGILANMGTVNNHGFITSTGDGVVFLGKGHATVTNWGLITNTGTVGYASAGVYVQGGDATVNNYGTIAGEASQNAGVFAGSIAQVNNHGSIFGQELGVLFTVSGCTLNNFGTVSSDGGDSLFAEGNDVLNNLGTISDTTSLGIGAQMGAGSSVTNGASNNTTASIVAGKVGVFCGGGSTVTNAGTITGGAIGVQSPGIVDNSGLISSTGYGVLYASTLVNSGTVRGGVDGVFSPSIETVSNSGTIIGDNMGLALSAGSSVTNSGTIAGATGLWLTKGSKLTDSGSIISTAGAAGTAVRFGSNSQLVVDPVAKFVGGISGPGAVLELAAGSEAGSIGGITQLGTLAVDKAASWTLQGTNDVSDVSDQGNLTVGANGTLTVAGTFDDGGMVALDAGALLNFISGVGSSGQMQFLGSAGLEIQHAAKFGTGVGTSAYAGPLIEGFSAGDTIDLRDIGAKGATMNYTASTGLMQITSGANVASLLFDTANLGSGSFHLGPDNSGHLLVTHF